MIKIGRTVLGGAPRVAVSFGDRVAPKALREFDRSGLTIAELRIDRYASCDRDRVLSEVKKFKIFPTLATIRSRKEGGGWNRSEEERLALFQVVLPHVSAVDIELSSKKILKQVVGTARALKKPVIISYHNFSKTPTITELTRVLREAKSSGATIVKIATMARSSKDVRTLAAFTLANASHNLITIAMGSEGVVSRLLFPALGSLLTYASSGAPGQPGAPGQLDFRTTSQILRTLYPQ